MLLLTTNTPRQIGTSFCAFILHSQPYFRANHQHATFHTFLKNPVRYIARVTTNISIFIPHDNSAHAHLHNQISTKTIIDISESDIFTYKAQRWLWNEPSQLQRRYLKFNIPSLIHAAEKALVHGAKCVEMTKLPEGNLNKTLLLQMVDGREVIAKLPNPNAGKPYYTTTCEFATMDYVCSL